MKSSHTRLLTGTKGEQGGQGWLRQGRLAAIDGCDKDKRGRRGSHKWLLTGTKGMRGTELGQERLCKPLHLQQSDDKRMFFNIFLMEICSFL